MDESASCKIIDSFPLMNDEKKEIGTTYYVCVSDGKETEFVVVKCKHSPDKKPIPIDKTITETPVEAYAALVRLYLDWLEKNDAEKYSLVTDNTAKAIRRHLSIRDIRKDVRTVRLSDPVDENIVTQYIMGAILGDEYNDYVNSNYVLFTEYYAQLMEFNSDDIAKKLHGEFEKYLDEFCDKILKDYAKTHDVLALEGQDMKDVIAGLKETVKKAMGTRICYTSVDLLLRRCTRKLLDENRRRILGTAEKPIELISIDDDKNGIANVLCDDYTFEADILEEGVLAKFKKQIISERKRYILDGLVAGYSQHDIAQSLGISDSAVSQAVKDIRKRLQSYKD